MRLRYLASALAVGGAVAPATAFAFSITLAPTVVAVEADRGETATFTMRIANNEEGTVPMRAYAWDYWHGPDGRYFAPPGTTPRSATGWIEVVPRDPSIDGNATVELLGTISIPRDAEGGYYAMVFVQTDFAREAVSGSHSVAEGRLGTVVLVRVKGTGTVDLDVPSATFVAATPTSPAGVAVVVRNEGDVHTEVTFKGVVRTTDGNPLGAVAIPEPVYVLPGESRTLDMRWSTAMEPGAYELVGALMYDTDRAIPVAFPLVVTESSAGASPGGR